MTLSLSGSSTTFDARADGYVRGEACVALYLKRVVDAQQDNNFIHAIIAGSSVNQDGASASLTAPSGLSQQDVLHGALRDASLVPNDIDYIEAHGTATALGDAVEFEALRTVFAAGRASSHPLVLGACKPNIGHTEGWNCLNLKSGPNPKPNWETFNILLTLTLKKHLTLTLTLKGAAGIVGLLKTVLTLKKAQAAPLALLDTLNPRFNLTAFPVHFPRELSLLDSGKTLYGGCSSFGFGGTNAHMILKVAPGQETALATPTPQFQYQSFPWKPVQRHPQQQRCLALPATLVVTLALTLNLRVTKPQPTMEDVRCLGETQTKTPPQRTQDFILGLVRRSGKYPQWSHGGTSLLWFECRFGRRFSKTSTNQKFGP